MPLPLVDAEILLAVELDILFDSLPLFHLVVVLNQVPEIALKFDYLIVLGLLAVVVLKHVWPFDQSVPHLDLVPLFHIPAPVDVVEWPPPMPVSSLAPMPPIFLKLPFAFVEVDLANLVVGVLELHGFHPTATALPSW